MSDIDKASQSPGMRIDGSEDEKNGPQGGSAAGHSADEKAADSVAPTGEGADTRNLELENCLVGNDQQFQSDHTPNSHPTSFDKSLAKSDQIIKWFTVVNGLSALISAIAAIYTVSQIKGSSNQVDKAISKIADAAGAAQEQAKALSDQLSEMKKQSNAATLGANAAQKSSSILSDTERRELRAYLSADVDQRDPIVEGMSFLNIALINHGATPAYDIKAISNTLISDSFAKNIPLNSSIKGSIYKGKGNSFPNNPSFLWINIRPTNLKPEDYPELQSGRKWIFLFGAVTYKDIFRELHFIRFCYRYNGSLSGASAVAECDWGA